MTSPVDRHVRIAENASYRAWTRRAEIDSELNRMLNIYPLKEARLADDTTHLPVLVQLQPSESRLESRPALNVGLVLDRSGSMHGEKMQLTIKAACEAVGRLTEKDKVSVVTFDDTIELLYSGTAKDERLKQMIESITCGNQTDLHSGWAQGAKAMRQFLAPTRLSRLILLTDGEANHGGHHSIRPQCLGAAVRLELTRRGEWSREVWLQGVSS